MIEIDYIDSESGFVIIDGLATGWYIQIDGMPVAGPWQERVEADGKFVKRVEA